MTPLILALKQNKVNMAEFLIKSGADIHAIDFLGRMTLMYAVRCKSERIIRLLFERAIDANIVDGFGWTAKRYAVESKIRMMKILTEYEEEDLTNPPGNSKNKKEDTCATSTTQVPVSLQTERVEKSDIESEAVLKMPSEEQPEKPEPSVHDQSLTIKSLKKSDQDKPRKSDDNL